MMGSLKRIADAAEALCRNVMDRGSWLEWRRCELDAQRDQVKALVRIADALEMQNDGVIHATIKRLERAGDKAAAGVLWKAYRKMPEPWPHEADNKAARDACPLPPLKDWGAMTKEELNASAPRCKTCGGKS